MSGSIDNLDRYIVKERPPGRSCQIGGINVCSKNTDNKTRGKKDQYKYEAGTTPSRPVWGFLAYHQLKQLSTHCNTSEDDNLRIIPVIEDLNLHPGRQGEFTFASRIKRVARVRRPAAFLFCNHRSDHGVRRRGSPQVVARIGSKRIFRALPSRFLLLRTHIVEWALPTQNCRPGSCVNVLQQ